MPEFILSYVEGCPPLALRDAILTVWPLMSDLRHAIARGPEVDVASQGDSVDEARRNLKEALELFFEAASPEEIKELRAGTLSSIIRQSGLARSVFE